MSLCTFFKSVKRMSTQETKVEEEDVEDKESEKNFLPSIKNYKILGSSGPSTHQLLIEIRTASLAEGRPFEDPDFELVKYYNNINKQCLNKEITWLRPTEICQQPQFLDKEYSRFEVRQGKLGDYWILAAISNLTLYEKLFCQVVPDDQSFDRDYAGVFHFRFWQYGCWIDVIIDDRLPTYSGNLIFMRSNESNEFWSALLEKAYAKLNGSYEALHSVSDAMEDFTGGMTEIYNVNDFYDDLNYFSRILIKAHERDSLMACVIKKKHSDSGLFINHAYSIIGIQYVSIKNTKILLLRLRNPWGNSIEWNGAWSDNSPEWRNIPDTEKEQMGFTRKADGEFWISFTDFIQNFTQIRICNLLPDSLDSKNNLKWKTAIFEGEWVKGVNAGGCCNKLNPFWINPQYIITMKTVDDDDNDNQCSILVGLLQKNRKSHRRECLGLGFSVYMLPVDEEVPKPLDKSFIQHNRPIASVPSYRHEREVTCRFKFDPGKYVIVPATYKTNDESEFMLRVFSVKTVEMMEYK